MQLSLNRAVTVALTAAVLLGLVPGVIVLDRRLSQAIEQRSRDELATAGRLLADRESMSAEMLTMHARGVADAPGLGDALMQGARTRAVRLARDATPPGEVAVLVGPDGALWDGPAPGAGLIAATRQGGGPVDVVDRGDALLRLAVVPVMRDTSWVGAAGVAAAIDETAAATLASLAAADVLVMTGGVLVAGTLPNPPAALLDSVRAWRESAEVREVRLTSGPRYLVRVAALGEGTVAFVRDRERELAVVPTLRRAVLLVVSGALVLTIVLGAVIARLLARPAEALARAADRLGEGDFAAPVPASSIVEIDRVGRTFEQMRRALRERLEDLEAANAELEDRQRRLHTLQAELIQRDRLAASGRLVAELAHEIRNPVANVRNCVEVIRRRLEADPTGREFADMAIDELLRMHELAERMLDMHRPHDTSEPACDVTRVVRDVASFVAMGAIRPEVVLELPERAEAGIPPDALKQVLLNLLQNAREAIDDRGTIEVTVSREDKLIVLAVADDGPGVPPEVIERLFDPFVTTKRAVHGVGLGLFVAEGIVRRYGGRIAVENRPGGRGARFAVELMAVDADVRATVPDRGNEA